MNLQRRYPIGAEVQPDGGTHFRVWAPRPKKVEVLLEAGPGAPATVQLKQQADGYFAGLVPQAAEGTRYRFRLDDGGCFPDPVSRYQPDGPHGASQVVDSSGFEWNDRGWQGAGLEGQIIYEMHIGTFTREGTWQAAQRELAQLAECGITVLEVMPVADFPGRFGWGYDGVCQFAPVRLYGEPDGLYHTADATLWFFHAINRYVRRTNDRATLKLVLPKLVEIIEHHRNGTRFGIGMDPKDALLRQGQQGYQLTWMDAKVGDWVVTPRRGKAVEINALWYNALRLMERWLKEEDHETSMRRMNETADRVRESFNERFWYGQGGYLYDVVDAEGGGSDAACRPNQIFAISLDHQVLEEARWKTVMDVVTDRLLTPVGLRSLAPGHADYKARYYGDLRSRDAAYHQGTVWPWLIGPYVDAWLKLNPGKEAEARRFLAGFVAHLDHACIGSVSEVFDAEAPYTPRGCVAQAWSVAEVLRSWVNTA